MIETNFYKRLFPLSDYTMLDSIDRDKLIRYIDSFLQEVHLYCAVTKMKAIHKGRMFCDIIRVNVTDMELKDITDKLIDLQPLSGEEYFMCNMILIWNKYLFDDFLFVKKKAINDMMQYKSNH